VPVLFVRRMSDVRASKTRRVAFGAWVLVLLAVGSTVGTSALGLAWGAGAPRAAPHAGSALPHAADPGAANVAALDQALGTNPTFRHALDAALDQAYASSSSYVRAAASRLAPSLLNETPAQVLARAGVSNLVGTIESVVAAQGQFSTLTFGNWSGYLQAAGTGCITGGLSSLVGGYAASYTGEAVVAGAEVSTKAVPIAFVLTCAIGAAAGLIIYQNGLNAAQNAVNYAGLWEEFAKSEWQTYSSYVNLTNSMFASLASLLVFAQVAMMRMADNAALLQIQDPTFNAGLDIVQSGVAEELGSMVDDYNYQLGQDFANVPVWLNALTAHNAYYDGYGYLGSGGVVIYAPQTNFYLNSSGLTNETGAGLAVASSLNGPVCGCGSLSMGQILYSGLPSNAFFVTVVHLSGSTGPYGIELSSASGHGYVRYYNFTAAPVAAPVVYNLPLGVYNVTFLGNSGEDAAFNALFPFAMRIPNATSPNMGEFEWMDRYYTEPGSVTTVIGSSSCSYTTATTARQDESMGSWLGASYAVQGAPTSYVQFYEDPTGNCKTGSAITPVADETTATTTVTWSGYGFAPASVDEWSGLGDASQHDWLHGLSAQVGQVILNASSSGQTYWTFIRSLGYTSLSQIPPDCVIPAPYQAPPSQMELGNLNVTVGLYQAWLRSMGTFYGQNGAFHVCVTGKIINPWNWTLNLTGWNPYVHAYGGIYLANATGGIWATGQANPHEVFGNTSTWSVPAVLPSPKGKNATLLIVPTLRSVVIPVGSTWAIPKDNPIWVLYAEKNNSVSNGNATAVTNAGNWSISQLVALTGNGTTDYANSTFGTGRGDALYLTWCDVNGTVRTQVVNGHDEQVCPVTLTNFSIYIVNITCGGACSVVNPSTGGGGGGLGACGSGIWLLGPLASEVANIVGFGALGCLVGWAVVAVVVVVLIAGVAWIAAAVLGRRN
jgi:hypothetical protein